MKIDMYTNLNGMGINGISEEIKFYTKACQLSSNDDQVLHWSINSSSKGIQIL
jgi:hypothetical protein